jgi:hypothetical protein
MVAQKAEVVMPSIEDMAEKEAEARELAVKEVMTKEKCSREMATKYVARLSNKEVAELIGWPAPGAPYSAW